ncbi:MAG: molybdopterin converting factor subunit 1 [Candidatus Marinimicrobia bacterium]|nr:molybdopterin converting factor subunit 1 [Candidatus Neomarinimicrobiota bacterium]
MKVKILFFASLKDITGENAVDLELEENATVESVKIKITSIYPKLEPLLNFVRIAINQEFAEAESVINNGDELAFLPPVSGG